MSVVTRATLERWKCLLGMRVSTYTATGIAGIIVLLDFTEVTGIRRQVSCGGKPS